MRAIRDFLHRRKQAYQRVFGNPEGDRVLADLAHFCRASTSTFHPDARMHAVLEGRREVWLRIQNHLNLNPERLQSLSDAGRPLVQPTEDD